MEYFEYAQVALEANINEKDLAELINAVKEQYPRDEMMADLHILRACLAVRDGFVTIDQVLGKHTA